MFSLQNYTTHLHRQKRAHATYRASGKVAKSAPTDPKKYTTPLGGLSSVRTQMQFMRRPVSQLHSPPSHLACIRKNKISPVRCPKKQQNRPGLTQKTESPPGGSLQACALSPRKLHLHPRRARRVF